MSDVVSGFDEDRRLAIVHLIVLADRVVEDQSFGIGTVHLGKHT
jgi:hypothetical protein